MSPAIDRPDPIRWLGMRVAPREEVVLRAIAACWDVFAEDQSLEFPAAIAISALLPELAPNRRRLARELAAWRLGHQQRDRAWSHVVMP